MKHRLLAIGFSALMVLTVGLSLYHPPNASAAANTDINIDRNRQTLIAANQCFDRTDVIDTDDSVIGNTVDDAYKDLIRDGDYGKTEKLIVGFDLDGGNGMDSCENLMPRALGLAHASSFGITATDEASGRQVMMEQYVLRGSSFLAGSKYKAQNAGNVNSMSLGAQVSDAIKRLPPPDPNLFVNRVAPLVGYCFTFTKDANPANYDANHGDFQVKGLGTFEQIDNIDWKGSFNWIKKNDGLVSTSKAAIGNLGLGFYGTTSVGAQFVQNNSSGSSSDFYPLGPEMSYTKGYSYWGVNNSDGNYRGAFVDCHFVKENAKWIFANKKLWSADTNGKLMYKGQLATANVDSSSGSGGGGSGSISDHNTLCEAHGWSISWLVCPIVNGLADAFDTLFEVVVKPLLKTGAIDISGTSNTYAVWSNFRLYGNVVLVIVLLIIVFGQSIGGGLIDAYSAKKIVPRLLIAAIAINLSIYLVALAVDITNIIGQGIYGVMTAPLESANALKFTLNAGTSVFSLGALAGAGFAVTFVTGVIPFILLAVVVPAFIAALGVVVTLVLRRAIIIILIIVSPVAFALYCLPNTEQYFRKWWDTLFKTLMVYPITMFIIGGVNILAATIGLANPESGGLTGFFGQLVAIIVVLMPLFIIPFAFKISGGVVASIYGGISKASAGLKSASRRAGTNMLKKGWQQTLEENRFKDAPEGSLRSKVNRRGQQAAIVLSGRAGFRPDQGKIDSQRDIIKKQAEARAAEDPDGSVFFKDDNLSQAAENANTEAEFIHLITTNDAIKDRYTGEFGQRNLKRDTATYNRLRRNYGTDALKDYAHKRAIAGGTAYKEGADFLKAAIARAGGNSAALADIIAEDKQLGMQAGRPDQAGAAFGETMAIASRIRDGWTDVDGEFGAAGTHYTGQQYFDAGLADRHLAKAVLKAQGPGVLTHPSIKKSAIDNLIPEMQAQLDDALDSGDEKKIAFALANIENVRDGLSQSKPELADEFAEQVFGRKINVADLNEGAKKALAKAIVVPEGTMEREAVVDPATGAVSYVEREVEAGNREEFTFKHATDAVRGTAAFQSKRRELSPEENELNRGRGGGGDITTGPITPIGGGPTT